MKEHINGYAELIIHVSGAIILIIPAVYPFVQFIRLAPQWTVIFLITVTVIAIGIVLLEYCKGKAIGRLFQQNEDTSSKQLTRGDCNILIPQELKKIKEHRKDILPENGEYYT